MTTASIQSECNVQNKNHLPKEYKCTSCGYTTQDVSEHSHECSTRSIQNPQKERSEQFQKQVRCSYCDAVFSTAILLDEHIRKTCTLLPVDCVLKSYGCRIQILRKDLQQHYLSEVHQKSLLLTEPLNNIQRIKMDEAFLINDNRIDISSEITNTSTTNPAHSTIKKCNGDFDQIDEALNIVSSGAESINHEIQHLQIASVQKLEHVNETEERLRTIQALTEQSNAQLRATNISLNLSQEQFFNLKERIEEHQYVSYDGTFLWKISNVQQKIDDARSGRQTSIYSPPFYSSPSGYKMCARLYIMGDGNARQTHLSLFFILMRGINDPILKFPFEYKVTFCLYDQSDARKHIIDSFRPDTRSNSFQRPSTEMNIASGIPKFAPLSVIQQSNSPFVKHDTMFIKIMVDFANNIPKAVLPFAMMLNPGLPKAIQQRLIQEEIQKHDRKNVASNNSTTSNHFFNSD